MTLGSCGETSERMAARAHTIIAAFSTLAAIIGAMLAIAEAVITIWHFTSRDVHVRRAREKGEIG